MLGRNDMIFDLFTKMIPLADKWIPDVDARDKFKAEAAQMAFDLQMKQMEMIDNVNKLQVEQNKETIIHWLARPLLFMGMTVIFLIYVGGLFILPFFMPLAPDAIGMILAQLKNQEALVQVIIWPMLASMTGL